MSRMMMPWRGEGQSGGWGGDGQRTRAVTPPPPPPPPAAVARSGTGAMHIPAEWSRQTRH